MSSKNNQTRPSRSSNKSPTHLTSRLNSNSPVRRLSTKSNSETLRKSAIKLNSNKNTHGTSPILNNDEELINVSDESEIDSSDYHNQSSLPSLDGVAVFVKNDALNDIYKCLKCNKVKILNYLFFLFFFNPFFIEWV